LDVIISCFVTVISDFSLASQIIAEEEEEKDDHD
jgi:hypothetical protein